MSPRDNQSTAWRATLAGEEEEVEDEPKEGMKNWNNENEHEHEDEPKEGMKNWNNEHEHEDEPKEGMKNWNNENEHEHEGNGGGQSSTVSTVSTMSTWSTTSTSTKNTRGERAVRPEDHLPALSPQPSSLATHHSSLPLRLTSALTESWWTGCLLGSSWRRGIRRSTAPSTRASRTDRSGTTG